VSAAWGEVGWPAGRLGEALAALARHSGLGARAAEAEVLPPAPAAAGGRGLERWVEAAAAWLGFEAEAVEAPYPEVEALLRKAAPALLRLPGRDPSPAAPAAEARFLALLGGGRRHVTVLTPERDVVRLDREAVRAALCGEAEAPAAGGVEQVLLQAGIPRRRWRRARAAVLQQVLVKARVGGCWLLRPAGDTGFVAQAREAGLPRLLAALLSAHTLEYGLWILSWGLLGRMSLQGHLDRGWLLAWLLLLLTIIPFRLLTTAAGGLLSIRMGAILKRRLLGGALKLEPDEVRHLGVGGLLGRVIESEVVESMALAGGFLAVTAVIELACAGFVLGAGAGGWVHVVLLLGTALVAGLLGLGYYRRRQRWTEERLAMTNDLVEGMIGHRTRLAQEAGGRWNEGEDQALERYFGVSAGLDRAGVVLRVVVPRLWFLLGFLGLAPAFVAGRYTVTTLAVGVGGVVLAYRALRSLADGLDRLVAAALAWERVQLFWQAAARREPVGHPALAVAPAPAAPQPQGGVPLLDARELAFRYPGRPAAVLEGVDVGIRAGDRLLLEGPSGGGKSTLAALLSGGRVPQAGLLLLGGLDRETLGAGVWRRRVALAPQFHDNHVLIGTFALNLLLGRGWPPRPGDLEEAEGVCRGLGLGPLLGRMPAGLQQMVGETGWQLSHGEKSRLYLARALLQGADVIILDESFAALDPQTLRLALAFVLERAPTVLVIAHP
jgi:ATP-binding cassette subfamily B protein